jgi:phosphomevalonate kinase
MITEKTEVPGLVRDLKSQALVNTNVEALNAYKSMKKQMLDLIETKSKVDKLENDVSEIKQLLQKIVEKI